MEDAWLVASYLGDADLLLSSFRGVLTRYNEAENVLQSAAASVAVRGVLFGNSHPLPSRFFSLSSLYILVMTNPLYILSVLPIFVNAGGMLFVGQSSGKLSNHHFVIRFFPISLSVPLHSNFMQSLFKGCHFELH